MVSNLNAVLVLGAGLVSVLSPCVIPVVPLIVTGTAEDHKLRPLLIVSGLALAFVAMGVASSLFGAVIGPWMYKAEKVVGAVIALFGLLLIFNVNLFEHLSGASRLAQHAGGRTNGFVLGVLLGVIWIPCVGPMLSSVLALVATEQRVTTGIAYLLIYSVGFSMPMLLVAYASQTVRSRFRALAGQQRIISAISGVLLMALGLFIVFKGAVAFGSLVT
ncbi:MAG TPA: cytochrome c biogenesis CcdA family protein [Gemmatimonadaceae bacterium]